MHDFRKLVAPHRKQKPSEAEIVDELAGHLEETYAELRSRGASDESALAIVSTAGKNLGPTIRRLRWESEDGFRTWLRAVVLPGLILALCYGVCNIALGVYWECPALWREAGLVLVSAAFGFCASSFSKELGGRKIHRLWAAAVVILLQAGALCIMVFFVTPMQLSRGDQYFKIVFLSLLYILLWDVVVPTLSLVIGGLVSTWAFPSLTRAMTLKGTAV